MTTPKSIIAILIFFLLISCGRTIKLADKDFRWIPYKGNEILVFNSNTGDTDTIFLLGTSRQASPSDPLAVFPTNLEHFTITSRRSDPSPPDGNHRYLESNFVEIFKGKEGESFLSIDLTAKDAWFYGGKFLALRDLDIIKPVTFRTKSKQYNDIIILAPESNEYSDRSNFLTKVYWSKSEGLIRFDKKDSVYWELTTKYDP